MSATLVIQAVPAPHDGNGGKYPRQAWLKPMLERLRDVDLPPEMVEDFSRIKSDLESFITKLLGDHQGSYGPAAALTLDGKDWWIFGEYSHGDLPEEFQFAEWVAELHLFDAALEPSPPVAAHVNSVGLAAVELLLPNAGAMSDKDCGNVWGEHHRCSVPHVIVPKPTGWDLEVLRRHKIGYVVDYTEDYGESSTTSPHWSEDQDCDNSL